MKHKYRVTKIYFCNFEEWIFVSEGRKVKVFEFCTGCVKMFICGHSVLDSTILSPECIREMITGILKN